MYLREAVGASLDAFFTEAQLQWEKWSDLEEYNDCGHSFTRSTGELGLAGGIHVPRPPPAPSRYDCHVRAHYLMELRCMIEEGRIIASPMVPQGTAYMVEHITERARLMSEAMIYCEWSLIEDESPKLQGLGAWMNPNDASRFGIEEARGE